MQYTEDDLAHLVQPPQAQTTDQASRPADINGAHQVEPEEYEEYEEEEQEYEQPDPYRGWRVRSILVMAWNLFGMAAAWAVVGWLCCLPFVGPTIYALLMAPSTIGLSALISFFYLVYWRGLSLSRLETVFQIVAMHSIVHDFCRSWFNGFPQ